MLIDLRFDAGLGLVVVALAGEIDAAFEDSLRDAFDLAWEQATTGVVVDLSHVSFMDCTGVNALTRLRVLATRDGLGLVLVGPKASLMRIFEVLDLWSQFVWADTVKVASAQAVWLARPKEKRRRGAESGLALYANESDPPPRR